jgi:hypothetical protein
MSDFYPGCHIPIDDNEIYTGSGYRPQRPATWDRNPDRLRVLPDCRPSPATLPAAAPQPAKSASWKEVFDQLLALEIKAPAAPASTPEQPSRFALLE